MAILTDVQLELDRTPPALVPGGLPIPSGTFRATVGFRVVYTKTEIAKNRRFGLSIELRGSDQGVNQPVSSNILSIPPLFSFPLGRPGFWNPFVGDNVEVLVATEPDQRSPITDGVRFLRDAVVPDATLNEDPGGVSYTAVIPIDGALSEVELIRFNWDEIFAVVRLRQIGREMRGFAGPVQILIE